MQRLWERLRRHGIVQVNRHGVVRLRGFAGLTRREFALGTAAGAALATFGGGRAQGATDVNFMGWQGYDEGLAAGDVLSRHDLRINPTYMNDNNQIIATATGGGISSMDIVTPDTSFTQLMAAIGILEPIDLAQVPNAANLFDEFKSIPGTDHEGTRYSIPFTWGSVPVMFDPAKVAERPTSLLDMFKPEYKGKVAIVNDVIGVMIPFTMAVLGSKTPTRVTPAELDKVIAELIRFKKEHARTIAPGYGELADLFASGEVVMSQAWQPVAAWAAAKGAKLEWVNPKEGTHTFSDCLAMVKDAPHKAEAYLLIDNGCSGAAQAHVANANATGVTVRDAVPLLNEEARGLYPYDDIKGFFANSGGGPFPIWPLEKEGDFVTFDDVLNGWEKLMKA